MKSYGAVSHVIVEKKAQMFRTLSLPASSKKVLSIQYNRLFTSSFFCYPIIRISSLHLRLQPCGAPAEFPQSVRTKGTAG
jgi:hypothetical protein